jgi:beta-1,4-N-acetylglucosaminyltransferase
MIFVTVGTTYFDELVAEVDRLVGEGVIRERVVAQIGQGKYTPDNLEWFRYAADLDVYYSQADVVICHGGVGTVFELLEIGKSFVAVANRDLPGDHQDDLLRAMGARGWCVMCCELTELGDVVRNLPPCRPYRSRAELPARLWSDLVNDLGGRRAASTGTRG